MMKTCNAAYYTFEPGNSFEGHRTQNSNYIGIWRNYKTSDL